jgi:hypothetical protein
MILYTFTRIISLFPLLVLLFSDRKTCPFFLLLLSSGKADRKSHASSHKKNQIMSDEEFDLKKKKKKSKKVDFDAFETEDTPNDGGDAGVAAAVAEKIEDLDRTCFVFFSRFGFFFVFFFLHPLLPFLTQQQFSFGEKRW